jgi:hypothetical protein
VVLSVSVRARHDLPVKLLNGLYYPFKKIQEHMALDDLTALHMNDEAKK